MYTSSILTCLSLTLAVVNAEDLIIPNIYGEVGEDTGAGSPFVAAKINEDATATTYSVGCTESDTTYCPSYWNGYTYKLGASQFEIAMTDHNPASTVGESADYTISASCNLLGQTTGTYTAVCAESYGGKDANFPGQSTETYTYQSFLTHPVVRNVAASTTATAIAPVSTSAFVTSTASLSSEMVSMEATKSSESASITRAPSSTAGVAAVGSSVSAGLPTTTSVNSAGVLGKSVGYGSVLTGMLFGTFALF